MQNNRRAGKPAGKKPDKTGLLGLFTKGKDIPTTAQQTLPYREMYRDGVCRVEDRYYTKTIEYEDINYQLAQTEDQAAIFDGWSACLNYFDSSLPFQLSFLNHRSRPGSRYSVNIPMQEDDYNSVRREYVEMLENQIAKSNNGIVRTKLLTFGVNVDDLSTARARLERVEADICGNFKKLGVKCRSLSGLERLELLHGQLHPGGTDPFRFSWDMIPQTGLSTKDFIAPDSFDFRFSRLFRVGTTWGAASYLQILASELSDKLLAELLEMDAEMTITLHIQTVDQAAAVKSIKAKVSDIDKMKVEEQKKAARAGYDMDILPPDLVTYSNDAKTLLEDLQSRNERMFLLTFLVVNMAPTRRELDNDLFTVSGKLIRLEWKKNNVGKYIRNVVIMSALICLFIFALCYLGIANDPDTGVPDAAPGNSAISSSIELFTSMAFLVFTSVMLSTYIVSAYKNKTMNLMFSYPIKRQKILVSQMLAVWIFNFVALVLTKLLIYGCILLGSQFMVSSFPLDYNMASMGFYVQLLLKAVVIVTMSFIALFVGMAMKSSKATIVSSFLLIFLTQANVGDFSLSDNAVLPAVLMVLSLVFAFLSIYNVETKDLN